MSTTLPQGRILAGTYTIVRRVGGGGMAEIYEARHARLHGRYAIKLLRGAEQAEPEIVARFEREAAVTSALRHPNIVQVLDFSATDDGAPFMVMEYLDGRDLAAALASSGPMQTPRVAALVTQIASGLAAAHAAGVVHRDLKPQNVQLVHLPGAGDELAKVVDFGISKVSAPATHLTRTDTVMGTPQYMAPEQARGRHDLIDARTDQFALAVIAYELLTGRPPWSGDSLVAIAYQVVHEEPPSLYGARPELPRAVDAVLRRALAKHPEARFPSILAFARALASALAVDDAEAPIARPHPRKTDRRRARGPAPVVPMSAITTTLDAPGVEAHASEGASTLFLGSPRGRRRGLVVALLGLAALAAATLGLAW